jgi:hypothetical protein
MDITHIHMSLNQIRRTTGGNPWPELASKRGEEGEYPRLQQGSCEEVGPSGRQLSSEVPTRYSATLGVTGSRHDVRTRVRLLADEVRDVLRLYTTRLVIFVLL